MVGLELKKKRKKKKALAEMKHIAKEEFAVACANNKTFPTLILKPFAKSKLVLGRRTVLKRTVLRVKNVD